MKSLVVLFALTTIFVFPSRAETPASQKLAMDLLTTMDFCGMLDKTLDQMKASQMKQLKGRGGPQVISEMERSFALMRESLDCEQLKSDTAAIYADMFTEEELRGVLAFFQSDIGKSFNAKQPELMRRSMEISMGRMQEAMGKAMQKMRDENIAPVKTQVGPVKQQP